MDYRIFTDSAANLSDELISKNSIDMIPLTYYVDGKEYRKTDNGSEAELKEFYRVLRARAKVSTSSANAESFIERFEPSLKDGLDIIYISFSSALSCTYNASVAAAQILKEKYPERKIFAIDSLCASMGQGKLVVLAAEKRAAGMNVEENAAFIDNIKLKILHCFTVDDLFFLYRGGRVTKTAYLAGTLAQIKPVMHVDDMGRLVPVAKVMGRKRSLKAICDMFVEKIVNPEDQTVYIAHGDCPSDAEYVKSLLLEKIHPKDFYVYYIDPIIGTHSGPGTMAIFGVGSGR